METNEINLKAEHQNTLNRKRYTYSFMAKIFFFSMDLIAGKKDNLSKVKLLEMLASIPYRAWEIRHYLIQTRKYFNQKKVKNAQTIIDWGRDAQDNEYMHLLIIHEKMKKDEIKDAWYLNSFFTFFIIFFYIFISKTLAFFNQKRAFLFNAEFENHAEHVYAKMVVDNPQWESQELNNDFIKKYYNVTNWADVFRKISLDERDHMNNSFLFCGKSDNIVKYEGMPELYI